MATNTCTTCGCKKCGCADNALTTPPPCPTPEGCPDPIPCSEYFDSDCIIYTGLDIECIDQVVVETDTNISEALQNIIDFFCEYITGPDLGSVVEVCDTNDYLDITSVTNPTTGVTTYTVCFDPNELPVYLVDFGTGINVTSSTVGNNTTYTVSNTDPGSAQNIFKNIAVASQSTVIADSNNDTLTLVAGTGIQITTNAITDEITITNNSPGSAVTLTDAGTSTHESLVNDGTGPSLATKGLKAGTGITLSSTATDVTIGSTAPGYYADLPTLPGAGTVTVTHNLNSNAVIVSVIDDNTNIALVHGVDYTWSVINFNAIQIADAAFGGGAIRVAVVG